MLVRVSIVTAMALGGAFVPASVAEAYQQWGTTYFVSSHDNCAGTSSCSSLLVGKAWPVGAGIGRPAPVSAVMGSDNPYDHWAFHAHNYSQSGYWYAAFEMTVSGPSASDNSYRVAWLAV
jgi:hypothetical protein